MREAESKELNREQKWEAIRSQLSNLLNEIQGWNDLRRRLGQTPSNSSERALLNALFALGYFLNRQTGGWNEAKTKAQEFLSHFRNGSPGLLNQALAIYTNQIGTKKDDHEAYAMKKFVTDLRELVS